jgi:hypothetical protein
VRALRTVIVVGLAAAVSAAAGERPPDVEATRARQMVTIFGLEPLELRLQRLPPAGSLEATLVRMQLRDDILAELGRISLLINATVAQLDQEQSAAAAAGSFVEDGYTRAIAGWNIAALLVGNSLSIVGTALQFDGTHQAYVGDALILGGAALATSFSIVALSRRHQARVPHPIDTNFLAQLLGATPTAESELPAPVWRYLDTPLAGDPGSARGQLLERWRQRGTLPRDTSGPARRKLELLTRPLGSRQVVSADALNDRAEMLADLRARVAGMHVDVQSLVRKVRADLAMQ